MHQPVEYDAFADIYDIWTETALTTKRNLPFYVEEYLRTAGPVVELGVGNGQRAVEASLTTANHPLRFTVSGQKKIHGHVYSSKAKKCNLCS